MIDLREILEEVCTKERWRSIFDNVAMLAEDGDLKAVKLLADYCFFPPKVDTKGQLKIEFTPTYNLSTLSNDELEQLATIQRKLGIS